MSSAYSSHPVRRPGSRRAPSAAPEGSESWPRPWVQMKYFSYHPCIYRAMLGAASPDARPGDWVAVYDKAGKPFGAGLYNPPARVPLRVLHHGPEFPGEDFFPQALERAVAWRVDRLRLPESTDAFRVVHSDGDGLSGLIIDRYADLLYCEVHSLGIWRRLPDWLPALHARLGTSRHILAVEPAIARLEGIPEEDPADAADAPRAVKIREHGVRYEVDFAEGHKTGFFCDQRENRRRLAGLVRDRRVLDLCCYTGGFSLAARILGGAAETTGVDLDEKAVAQARRNANLNQQSKPRWVHADAFHYARQMASNGAKWDVVVLDPPKLIERRGEEAEGLRKYEDLNQLALGLVERGGLFVTCSCSGLLPPAEFERLVIRSAHRGGRRLQFFDHTGAGPDHPVRSNCPESLYLKAIWAVVE